MSTLIDTQPDSFDLDYWYFKYQGRFGFGMTEDKPQSLRILPANVNPKNCKVKNNKNYHFFLLPIQPALKTCICGKYYANFNSKFFKITPPPQQQPALAIEISSTISKNRFNRISKKLPESPAPQITSKILFPNFSLQSNPNLEIIPHSQHTHYCTI
ncbi:4171_t:CDS:1, partial [Dentiscutata erythropus]